MNMRSFIRASVCLLACYGAGFLASLFVVDGVRAWYDALLKPPFTPPDWIFGLVWVVLYGLMAIALYLVWEKDPYAAQMRGWVPLFFAHLLINASYAMFFFGFNTLLISFIDSVLLFGAVALLTAGAKEIDTRAFYCMLPYLLWTFYGAILSCLIWMMN